MTCCDPEPQAFERITRLLAPLLVPGVETWRSVLGCWLLLVDGETPLSYVPFCEQPGVVGARRMYLHQFTFSKFRGELRPDTELHHACRVQSCFNPWHLAQLTPAEHKEAHDLLYHVFDYSRQGRDKNRALWARKLEHRVFAWQVEERRRWSSS